MLSIYLIKTTMRYHLTPVTMAIINKSTNNKCWGECREKGTLLNCGWECKWYNHYGDQYGGILENYTQNYHMTEQSHSWAYILDKTFLKKDTCTCMFIEALFTIAKTWKQPKCPSTDGWIRKMWYIHTMEYYSAIKKTK